MIVAAFHTRDLWPLTHKLRVYSLIADRIIVALDRFPEGEEVCRRFPKVEWIHYQPSIGIPATDEHGSVCCAEGALRQLTFDAAAKYNPKWILLGDTDEYPTPDISDWLASDPDPKVDCWYLDLVNLFSGVKCCIAGDNVYSYRRIDSNKRGAIIRYRPGKEYRYRTDAIKHVRLEPSPVNEGRAVEDATHRRTNRPKMVHYKFANWPRWEASAQSKSEKYQRYLADVHVEETPKEWLWRWDAVEFLRNLPEPIAVVGNGPMIGHGAEIDSHPSVIRFNNFLIEGYEPHVGKKTTAWYTNCWKDVANRPWTDEMFTIFHEDGPYGEQVSQWLGMYPHMRLPDGMWYADTEQHCPHRPTSGFVVLNKLAEFGKRVDAYGFDGMKSGHYWNLKGFIHSHGGEDKELARLAGKINFR